MREDLIERLRRGADISDEKIDVLAVMDAAAQWRGDFMGDFTSAAELKASRAAVAELIEAAEAATAQVMHNGTSSREACERLDAAWRACVAVNA